MSRCLSCGWDLPGGYDYLTTCPHCAQVKASLKIEESTVRGFEELARIQERGFERLSDGLSEVVSVMEWGFEEINWELHQQTALLKSIDHKMEIRRQLEAIELRRMGENYFKKGKLEKAEKSFLEAIELYGQDCRTYIGLHFTYLELGRFDEAMTLLQESLDWVPERKTTLAWMGDKQFEVQEGQSYVDAFRVSRGTKESKTDSLSDFKSYIYRLIGRIYYCKKEYSKAVEALINSVRLSPDYSDGHYDLAQYSALVGNIEKCNSSLEKAILGKPLYLYMARKERDFESLRSDVNSVIRNIETRASNRASEEISKTDSVLKKANQSVASALTASGKSKDEATLESIKIYKDAKVKLNSAKEKVQSGDYMKLLESVPLSSQSRALALNATEKANIELKQYKEKRKERREWLAISGCGILILAPVLFLIGGVIGAIIGAIIGFFLSVENLSNIVAIIGALLGIVIAFLIAWLARPED